MGHHLWKYGQFSKQKIRTFVALKNINYSKIYPQLFALTISSGYTALIRVRTICSLHTYTRVARFLMSVFYVFFRLLFFAFFLGKFPNSVVKKQASCILPNFIKLCENFSNFSYIFWGFSMFC